jgi:hypothetical protein
VPDLRSKIQEYYQGKALPESKILRIQRMLTWRPRYRWLLYGPLGLIIFCAVLYKVSLNYFLVDPAVTGQAEATATPAGISVEFKGALAPVQGAAVVSIESCVVVAGRHITTVSDSALLAHNLPLLARVYQQALTTCPSLVERLNVRITFGRNGRVQTAEINTLALDRPCPGLEQKLRAGLLAWTIPPPVAGRKEYALTLRLTIQK